MDEHSIPPQFHDLFWDTDVSKIDINRDKWFVIESFVNSHDNEAAQWITEHYSQDDIIAVLTQNYNISTNAITSWATKLGFNPTMCKCTLRPSALRVFD